MFYNYLFLVIIILLLLVYALNYIYFLCVKLRHYPPGPTPLPLFGNCLMLIRNLNRHPTYFFKNLAQKYGDIYTFWLCSTPIVIISGIDEAKQAFSQSECCDRIWPSLECKIKSIFTSGLNTFGLMYFNEEYKTLRKVSADAIRKYLSGNKMGEITPGIVDESVLLMLKNERTDEGFVPFDYIDSVFIRILTEVTFGKKLSLGNRKIQQFQHSFDIMQKLSLKAFFCDFIPILTIFFNLSKQEPVNDEVVAMMSKWFNKLNKSKQYLENSCNSLCESHILAAINNRTENKERVQYLTDENIIGNLFSLFFGASDTTHYTFRWLLLLMAYYPDMQTTMRHEISSNIGKRIPDITDIEKCDFVNAFICETLRFRNVLPFGLMHTTSFNTTIGQVSIPKQTMILLNQFSLLNDSKHWKNADIFDPKRFLDSEQHFVTQKCRAFVPFGTGKRMCVGDKFAMNMLFLVLTRFIQTTNGYQILLQNAHKIDFEPEVYGFFTEPKPYKIILVKD